MVLAIACVLESSGKLAKKKNTDTLENLLRRVWGVARPGDFPKLPGGFERAAEMKTPWSRPRGPFKPLHPGVLPGKPWGARAACKPAERSVYARLCIFLQQGLAAFSRI